MRTALAALLVAVPLLGAATPAHAGCDVTVDFPDFDPDPLRVPPGTTVTWCWASDNHSVTFGTVDSGVRSTGATFAHTFGSAGTFQYHCVNHGTMQASVIVGTSSPSPTKTSPAAPKPTTAKPTTAKPTTAAPRPSRTATRTTAPITPAPSRTTPPPATTVARPAATTAPAPAPTTAVAAVEPAASSSRNGLPLALGLLAATALVGGAVFALRSRHG